MKNYGYWNEEWAQDIREKTDNEIEAAVVEMERVPAAKVEDLFNNVFENLPTQLIEQKEKYLAHLRG